MVKHVILDTDIGGDPDDFFALLLGLNSPEIKIDLIVTSDEHKGHRAKFAKNILEKLNIDIPIVMGHDLGNDRCCVVCDLVEDIELPETTNYLSAIKKVVKNNEKTYYVCISPQSNLAEFLNYAPELIPKLNVIIMGGSIQRKRNDVEHNVRYDVDAARKVFNSNLSMRWVLSDITHNSAIQFNAHHPIYKRLQESEWPAKELLIKNCQNFFRKLYPTIFMHDPLTLSYIIDPRFLNFEEHTLIMSEDGTMQLSEKGKKLIISASANYEEFMNFFSKRLPF